MAEGDGLRAVAEEGVLVLIGPQKQIIIHNLIVSLIFSHLLPFFTWCWSNVVVCDFRGTKSNFQEYNKVSYLTFTRSPRGLSGHWEIIE